MSAKCLTARAVVRFGRILKWIGNVEIDSDHVFLGGAGLVAWLIAAGILRHDLHWPLWRAVLTPPGVVSCVIGIIVGLVFALFWVVDGCGRLHDWAVKTDETCARERAAGEDKS